jgi:Pup amidohydrolase
MLIRRSLALPRSLDAMTVRRVMGTETEYGISVPGNPGANAMLISSQIVNAYAQPSSARNRRPRWDFEEESPLRDARGFDLARDVADPSQLTDEDVGLANVILTNGARFYVDHAHPEYSAPEVTNPRDAVIWDKAGERIMAEAARRALLVPGTQPINLYKNNTDNKGASYGTHENYLMKRETPFADIVRHLTPFFVSRQVVCGSGRVGIGQDGRNDGFQISQRADYFEVEVGLETTLKRPIINTRDEPHAVAEKYRRLHVIIGDANLAEVSTYLKLGTTTLVLAMIEEAFLSVDLIVDRPVATLHAVSHDPTLKELVTLRSGRKLTAVQLQMEYAEQARKFVEDRFGSDVDAVTADVLERWESVLSRLESDPMSLTRELDWVAKLAILEGYRARDGLDWSSPRLEAIDLQYSDVRPDKGLFNKLSASGRFDRIVTDAEIEHAIMSPPEDTRAYFRGRCLALYPEEVAAASWDSVIFDLPGRESLQRVPTLEPLRGTKEHVGDLFERCESAEELVRIITGG